MTNIRDIIVKFSRVIKIYIFILSIQIMVLLGFDLSTQGALIIGLLAIVAIFSAGGIDLWLKMRSSNIKIDEILETMEEFG